MARFDACLEHGGRCVEVRGAAAACNEEGARNHAGDTCQSRHLPQMRQQGQWERNGSPAREKGSGEEALKKHDVALGSGIEFTRYRVHVCEGPRTLPRGGQGQGRATPAGDASGMCVSDQGLVGSPERSTVRARQTKVKDKVRQYLSRDRSRAHRSRAGARGDEHMHTAHTLSRPPHREVFAESYGSPRHVSRHPKRYDQRGRIRRLGPLQRVEVQRRHRHLVQRGGVVFEASILLQQRDNVHRY